MPQISVVHPVNEALRKTALAVMLRRRFLRVYTQLGADTLDAHIKGIEISW